MPINLINVLMYLINFFQTKNNIFKHFWPKSCGEKGYTAQCMCILFVIALYGMHVACDCYGWRSTLHQSDLLLSTLILLFPPLSCLRADDALPSYCKSYLWLDQQITVRFHCGVRVEVHGSMKFFITGTDSTGGHWRKAGYLRFLSGYREGFIFEGFVLQMQFKDACRQRDPRCASDVTQGHAHSPSDIHSLQTESESVCYWEREWGKGGSESSSPVCSE